jgi:hypothetical protein
MSENGNEKTGSITGNGRFATGTDPRRGHGVKGRSGRKPNWLREFCDEMLASPKCKAQVKAILHDKTHPAFHHMWKAVGERAHGKPANPVEHSGEVAIRIIREPRKLLGDN